MAVEPWALRPGGFGRIGFYGAEDDAGFEADGDGGRGEPISGLVQPAGKDGCGELPGRRIIRIGERGHFDDGEAERGLEVEGWRLEVRSRLSAEGRHVAGHGGDAVVAVVVDEEDDPWACG